MFVKIFCQYRFGIGNSYIAEAAADHQTAFGQFSSASLAHKKGYVLSRFQQPSAKIAADRSCAHYQSPHINPLDEMKGQKGSHLSFCMSRFEWIVSCRSNCERQAV